MFVVDCGTFDNVVCIEIFREIMFVGNFSPNTCYHTLDNVWLLLEFFKEVSWVLMEFCREVLISPRDNVRLGLETSQRLIRYILKMIMTTFKMHS